MQEKKIKKVILNQDMCIGCAACSMNCPEGFEFDEAKCKGQVKEGAENVAEESLQKAVDGCPVQAISLEK